MNTPTPLIINAENGTIDRVFANGRLRRCVGTVNAYGQVVVGIRKRTYLAHRLNWEQVHGAIPVGMEIDHVNHDTTDNRIANLRLVTHKQNQENRIGAQRNSKSGVRGVSWDAPRREWRVWVSGMFFGRYRNLTDAQKAYSIGASLLHTCNPLAAPL